MQVSLRHRLRADTRVSHDIVDAAFADHNICDFDGYAGFLCAHLGALRTLALGYCTGNETAMEAETAPLMACLRADLAKLEKHPATILHGAARGYHPVSLRYVLLGSRMGLSMLRKIWARSDDPRVLGASSFLTMPSQSKDWRNLCVELEAEAATGALADGIISDAQAIFDIYAQAGRGLADPLQGSRYGTTARPTAGAIA